LKRKKCVLKEEEILALLRLQKTPSIGDILAKKLIATVGSAADIFTENKNTLLNGKREFFNSCHTPSHSVIFIKNNLLYTNNSN
jgi:hypothetical protein